MKESPVLIKLKKKDILFSTKVQDFCKLPYPDHPKGCPNYNNGKREDCPPRTMLIDKVIDLDKPLFLVASPFDLKAHVERRRRRMKLRNANWSERQLRNLLYWQNTAIKQHRERVRRVLDMIAGDLKFIEIDKPEAHGVNLNVMLIGLHGAPKLEWPPKDVAWRISLIGVKK